MRKSAYLSMMLIALSCNTTPEKTSGSKDTISATISSIYGEEIIPLKYTTIYIHLFDNRTYSSDAVHRLKEKIQISYNRDGKLKVTPEKAKAELWLYGEVSLFTQTPLNYDNFGQPVSYAITIICSIKVRENPVKNTDNNPPDGVLLDTKIVRFDTTYSPRIAPFETKFIAEERLLDGVSDRIIFTSFQGWYSEMKSNQELGYDKKQSENQLIIDRVVPKDLPKEQRDAIIKQQQNLK